MGETAVGVVVTLILSAQTYALLWIWLRWNWYWKELHWKQERARQSRKQMQKLIDLAK